MWLWLAETLLYLSAFVCSCKWFSYGCIACNGCCGHHSAGAANGGKGKGLAESKELKAKLKALGLPTKGSKSELKERLKEGEFKAARKRRSSAPATSMAM